jgi:hypothetical protein
VRPGDHGTRCTRRCWLQEPLAGQHCKHRCWWAVQYRYWSCTLLWPQVTGCHVELLILLWWFAVAVCETVAGSGVQVFFFDLRCLRQKTGFCRERIPGHVEHRLHQYKCFYLNILMLLRPTSAAEGCHRRSYLPLPQPSFRGVGERELLFVGSKPIAFESTYVTIRRCLRHVCANPTMSLLVTSLDQYLGAWSPTQRQQFC